MVYAGLFKQLFGGTVKNLTVKNATVKGNKMVGIIASNLDNNTSADPSYAAVLYAAVQNGINITIDNVNIYNTQIKDAQTVGGFVGLPAASGENTLTIKNSSVKKTQLLPE